MKKELLLNYLFLFFLGSITSFSLPPFNYVIINFFTFTSIFIFLFKKSKIHQNKKLFFLYGWFFGLGYFISSLYWISISLTFDEKFLFLIPFSLFFIPAFLAIFFGLAIGVFIEYSRNFKLRKEFNENKKKLLNTEKELQKSKEKFLTEDEKIFNLLD